MKKMHMCLHRIVLLWVAAILSANLNSAHAEWIQPDTTQGKQARPVWGIVGGMSIGLWPTPGPRGLLRFYTPYMGQPVDRMINFIAIEPIVGDNRGLSEMERSELDGVQGKRMWTTDAVDDKQLATGPNESLARGKTWREGGVDFLSFAVHVERFKNGGEPIVQVTFRSDRPTEVELKTFATSHSATLSACVLTATMGNWARLRHLHLRDRTIEASDLFHNAKVDGWGFSPTLSWPSKDLVHADGQISVSATGDLDTFIPANVPDGWRYVGRPALQTWATEDYPGVVARVNGRTLFWRTQALVPGGVAFENFELISPFHAGQAFVFRVSDQLKS